MVRFSLNIFYFPFVISILSLGLGSVYLSLISGVVLPLLSFLIIVVFFGFWCFGLRFSFINSFFSFSIMYMGYALGGYYYAFSSGYYGKFIQSSSLTSEQVQGLLPNVLVGVLIFYIIYCFFYFISGRAFLNNCSVYSKKITIGVNKNIINGVIFLLFFVGFVYWLYVSITLFGSVKQSIVYFQLFSHFVSEKGLTILPYLMIYTSVFLYAYKIVIYGEKISALFVLCLLFSIIVILSTARIAQAVVFLFSILLFLTAFRPRYKKYLILILVVTFFLIIFVHYARIFSNYYYLGLTLHDVDFDVFRVVIGGGNVSDLQQLILVYNSFGEGGYLFGSSYFDWIRNTLGKYFGIEPSSVGLLIHSEIFPSDTSSGAPTPGAVGELYANFGFFTFLFAALLGFFMRKIDTYFYTNKSVFCFLIYCIFVTHFVFLYAKVDSTMIVNFFWSSMPLIIMFGLLKLLSYLKNDRY